MEDRILEVMQRFSSVSRAVLLEFVLCRPGRYTLAAEREFDDALVRLKDSGRLRNLGGPFGFYQSMPTGLLVAQHERGAKKKSLATRS
jgi:hypothetical protein